MCTRVLEWKNAERRRDSRGAWREEGTQGVWSYVLCAGRCGSRRGGASSEAAIFLSLSNHRVRRQRTDRRMRSIPSKQRALTQQASRSWVKHNQYTNHGCYLLELGSVSPPAFAAHPPPPPPNSSLCPTSRRRLYFPPHPSAGCRPMRSPSPRLRSSLPSLSPSSSCPTPPHRCYCGPWQGAETREGCSRPFWKRRVAK